MDFLDYYRENLGYLRTLGAEFAAEFPKIAARLDLSSFECQDPYVERLLEGTAFLAARVQKKQDDGYLRLLESVLNSVAPDALQPVVSGAVVEMQPDPAADGVKKGECLPAGTTFDAQVGTVNTPCRFSTVWDAPLTPVVLADARYVTRDMAEFKIDASYPAALYLRLTLPNGRKFGDIAVSDLPLFLNLPESTASVLTRQLMLDVDRISLSENGEDFEPCGGVRFEMPVLSNGTLFSDAKGNLNGLRVWQNFLTYPAFFKFVFMKGLGTVLKKNTETVDILIGFKRREPELVNEIDSSAVKLNCAPVVNLFKKRSDRAFLDKENYEFHIVPERTSTRDYEVYSVRRLEFFNEKNETMFSAANFYDEDLSGNSGNKRNFFSVHRRRSLFDQKARQRSSYTGTDVFVSVSGQDANTVEATQFCADLVCTNRDLPLLLSNKSALTCSDASVLHASFAVMPTRPDYPLIERGDTTGWAKVGHVIFNLSGMLWQDGTFPLEMLKTLLKGYVLRSPEEMERMLEGIVELTGEPTTFRFIKNGTVFFETGWKIRLVLNEQAYAGIGFYTFATVMREIFYSFTPLNALLEVQLFTRQSGKIAAWKTLEN